MGYLNNILARVGGNLNNNFQKSQMPGRLPAGGGVMKLRFDRYIIPVRGTNIWNANTVTCLPMSVICIRDTIISSTHTFMSGSSMNILTYFPYIRSPLTNILRAYCDIRSVFFIMSRAFVDMYSARTTEGWTGGSQSDLTWKG